MLMMRMGYRKTAAMQLFDVTITEMLKMTVTVDADSPEEAERMVSDGWNNSEYILDAESFAGVGFEALEIGTEQG